MFSGIFQKEFDKSVSIETISKKLSAIGFTRISAKSGQIAPPNPI
jgi:hypothetical protein